MSQNFLVDPDVLEAILAEAAPGPGRHVLEIGPGLGFLTRGLLEAGAQVTAVELDRGLAAFLSEDLAAAIEGGGLSLIQGDALDQDLNELARAAYDVVANMPYHITSPILHRLLGETPRPERLVLMVQREVAERIAAPPGQMSYLSVFVQYHARVRVAFNVPTGGVRAGARRRERRHRRRAVPDGRPAAGRRGRGRPLASRPGRASASAARCSTTCCPPAARSSRPASTPRSRPPASRPDRRPQTVAVGEWLALLEAFGEIGPDTRGRRPSERAIADAAR